MGNPISNSQTPAQLSNTSNSNPTSNANLSTTSNTNNINISSAAQQTLNEPHSNSSMNINDLNLCLPSLIQMPDNLQIPKPKTVLTGLNDLNNNPNGKLMPLNENSIKKIRKILNLDDFSSPHSLSSSLPVSKANLNRSSNNSILKIRSAKQDPNSSILPSIKIHKSDLLIKSNNPKHRHRTNRNNSAGSASNQKKNMIII